MNEVQTIDLGDIGAADTFTLATGAAGTAKTGTITYDTTGAGSAMALDIQAKLNAVLGAGVVGVSATDQNTYVVTWTTNAEAVQLQVTDTATFTPLASGGYVSGVITTRAFSAAYILAADFHAASLAEYCKGAELETADISDALLETSIARFSQRFDDLTNDHYVSVSTTLDLDVEYWSPRLYLPQRFTALSSIATRDEAGTLTTQAAGVYRLHSSLNAAGTKRAGEFDWIDIVPYSDGVVSTWSAFNWPQGPQSVRVIGPAGWTVTPADVKRAVALMTYDGIKAQRGDLRRASRVSSSEVTTEYVALDPGAGIFTGIPEADGIIAEYRHESVPGV